MNWSVDSGEQGILCMIEKTLTFLRDEVNKYMRLQAGLPAGEDKVVLSNIVDVDQNDSIGLPENKVVLSLIFLEEERLSKSQDHYLRTPDGKISSANPPLKFNLYVLFAAHFNNTNYSEALKMLSLTVRFFQGRNVFDAKSYPLLSEDLDRLIVDLYTQPMDQQSQLWQALGGKFLPSVMYKIRLVTFAESIAHREIPRITEIDSK